MAGSLHLQNVSDTTLDEYWQALSAELLESYF